MKLKTAVSQFFLHDVLGGGIIGFLGTIFLIVVSGLPNGVIFPVTGAFVVLLQLGWFFLFRKKLARELVVVNGCILLLGALAFTVCMLIAGGNTGSQLMVFFPFFQFPYLPLWLLSALMANDFGAVFSLVVSLTGFLFPMLLTRTKLPRKVLAVSGGVLVLLAGISLVSFLNRPSLKYGGHGFEYMNGYSSTDFSDYMVYSNPSKLAELDQPAALRLDSDFPIMDGAEACYPLYAAAAKAVYANIADIEQTAPDSWRNGEYVQFTNSVVGFKRLLDREVDLFFGARPSQMQLYEAAEEGVEPVVTPIGREAFVFFVEASSPVENLTSQQLRDIYSGKITNWSQVGGKDQAILAFQRPQSSGSQTMMEYFMGDTPLKAPQTYEVFNSMGGVVQQVAQYHSEAGALGYSFRYFVEELNQEGNVKLLAIDGVAPTLENIKNGTYPLTVPLCLITLADNPNPNVAKMIDFILSPQGQELVEKTGYAPLG